MTRVQAQLKERFGHLEPRLDVELAPLSYFKIGGPAEVLFELKQRQDIIDVVQFCKANQIKLTILGGASNVVVSSDGIAGAVVITANTEYQILPERVGDRHVIRAGAGFKTALFVRKTIDDGFAGLEYFLGVPGKLGGAVFNNAHYMADLIGQHIHRVEVIRPDGQICWLTSEACHFEYDSSIFHTSGDTILQAEFSLAEGEKGRSMELVKEATIYRAKTQPLGQPSSGCYFQNTPNTEKLQAQFPQFADRRECPTAFLIDQAGLKGARVGDVQVSEKHAAFLINLGEGTSQDVQQLAAQVKQRVYELYRVELHEEVFLLK